MVWSCISCTINWMDNPAVIGSFGLDKPSGTSVSLAVDDSFGGNVRVNDNQEVYPHNGIDIVIINNQFLNTGVKVTIGHMGYDITFPSLGSTGNVELEILSRLCKRASGQLHQPDISTSSGCHMR